MSKGSEYDSSNDLEHAVQQFINMHLCGDNPNIDEYISQYPTIANQLRRRINCLSDIDTLFSTIVNIDIRDFHDMAHTHKLIGQVIGDYKIIKLIGEGGMGVVFLALQITLDREVALKVISDIKISSTRTLERFKREAKSLAKISHPNIVPIYDINEQAPYYYFSMEYIKGVSLDKILAKIRNACSPDKASLVMNACLQNDTLTENIQSNRKVRAIIDDKYILDISNVIIKIANALECAHSKSILHRDVKPSNILIDSRGVPKLVDFGLAKNDTQESITLKNDFFGTPNYVSPEQIYDSKLVDQRSDVYSLAATYYECLTLKPPFEGDTVNDLFTKVISQDVLPPKKLCNRLSKNLNVVLLHALNKSPSERYQTASDFANDIKNALEQKPLIAKKPTCVYRLSKLLRKNIRHIAVLSFLLVNASLIKFLDKRLENQKEAATIDSYKEVIDREPDNPYAWMDLGNLYVKLGYYEDAIDISRQAISIDPLSTGAYNQVGFAYCKLKRWEEARAAYEEVVNIDPNNHEAISNLGIVYGRLGKYEEAVRAIKETLSIKPGNVMAYKDWGRVLIYRAMHEEGADRERLLSMAEEKCLKAELIQFGTGAYDLACIYAMREDITNCKKWLNIGEQSHNLPTIEFAMSEACLSAVKNERWFKRIRWSKDLK